MRMLTSWSALILPLCLSLSSSSLSNKSWRDQGSFTTHCCRDSLLSKIQISRSSDLELRPQKPEAQTNLSYFQNDRNNFVLRQETEQQKMTLNPPSSYLYLPNAAIMGMHHHVWQKSSMSFSSVGLGTQLRALHMLDKHATAEIYALLVYISCVFHCFRKLTHLSQHMFKPK